MPPLIRRVMPTVDAYSAASEIIGTGGDVGGRGSFFFDRCDASDEGERFRRGVFRIVDKFDGQRIQKVARHGRGVRDRHTSNRGQVWR